MQTRSIKEIEHDYELEIDRIVKEIKKQKARIVLLQFPDGMKPYATAIADEIEKRCAEKDAEKNKVKCIIWFGSCFGACDVPQIYGINPEIDLVVQFGHSAWHYDKKSEIKILS